MTRKELKKNGHKVFHRHYFILVFICLIVSLFGTEGGNSVQLLKTRLDTAIEETTTSFINANDVIQSISDGNLTLGQEMASAIEEKLPDQLAGIDALGMKSGVIAGLVNSVMSGRFYLKIAEGIFGITHSEQLTGLIFVLINTLVYVLVWIFLRNILSAVIRRMFLEAGTYEKLPMRDMLHFMVFRKWFHASFTMFVTSVFQFLWSLTIVGGFIKHYSYYLVPYIVAENPGIGPLKAIKLSRKMMNGHKWEAFVFDLSFILWYLLSMVTFGLSDLFYGFPYRIAARAQYYIARRQEAKESSLAGAENLNDTALYEIQDKITLYEAYFDIVDMQTLVLENKVELNLFQRFMVNWLGLWFGSLRKKKIYDREQGWKSRINAGIRSRDGKAYPVRLNRYWKPRKHIEVPFTFIRTYSLWSAFLLFIVFCIIGWIWEVGLHYMQTGMIVNRGVLHGPWLPIYGCGGIIALLLCSRFRAKPEVEFVVATALCGTIEYFTSLLLELRYHEKWWSYDGMFLNIHGRICAEALLAFGIACMLVVYLIAPFFDFLISKLPNRVIRVLAIAFMAVFIIDTAYSAKHPNVVPGAVETKTEAGLIRDDKTVILS